MRVPALLVLLAPLLLAACGGTTERTVVVQPQPGQTVVVPPSGHAYACPSGASSC
jgi:hypothetical protein